MWDKTRKAQIRVGNTIRDNSGDYACPVCWNINRGYENHHRLRRDDPECPICKVELEWVTKESV